MICDTPTIVPSGRDYEAVTTQDCGASPDAALTADVERLYGDAVVVDLARRIGRRDREGFYHLFDYADTARSARDGVTAVGFAARDLYVWLHSNICESREDDFEAPEADADAETRFDPPDRPLAADLRLFGHLTDALAELCERVYTADAGAIARVLGSGDDPDGSFLRNSVITVAGVIQAYHSRV